MKKLLSEEGFVDEAEVAGSYVAELNKLTGLPLPTDTLLFAIPVCAPYSSVAKYKYRVKLTPGVGKKGRTGKQALDLFSRMKTCTPRERDLIRLISDNEIVQTIIGDSKVNCIENFCRMCISLLTQSMDPTQTCPGF